MTGSSTPPFHRFAEQFSDIPRSPLATWIYDSDELFERERTEIFGKMWLCIGRDDQVPKTGDFFVKDIHVQKASVIVVRDRDGKLKAHHNVCKHRGNKVEWGSSGKCRAFTCKFHGWSYKLDGTLADVPDEERFFGFDKSENGLRPVHVDVWRGFIFVCLAEKPALPLNEFLGEFGQNFADYPFEAYPTCFTYRAEINCNWKIVTDAFQEAYHVPHVHGKVLTDYHHDPELHLLESVSFDKNHATFAMPSAKEHLATPAEALGLQHTVNIAAAISHVENAEESADQPKMWGFVGNRVFPNFFCDVLDGLYFTHEILPISKNRTWYEHRMYFAEPQSAAAVYGQEISKIMLRDALLEDLSTLEHTQSAMEGRVLDRFQLQDEEIVLRDFYKTIGEITDMDCFNLETEGGAA